MASLIGLPAETLNHIFSYADEEICKELALTCSLLNSISKRWLLRWRLHKARVSPHDRSCERFEKLSENKDLSQYTTKIYLDASKWKSDDDEEDSRVQNGDTRRVFLPLPERFLKLFDCLREFPSLQSVVLCFPHMLSEQDGYLKDTEELLQCIGFRSHLMERFMSALSSLPRPPQELAIRDLQNVSLTHPEVVAMARILGCLRSLRLNITDVLEEGNGENDILEWESDAFFSQLPSSWLQPAASNLRHLTLYSSRPFGFDSKLDLSEVHFSQLKTLSFGNYTFINDFKLDWILSHSATLAELYLDNCPIVFEAAVYDTENTYLPPEAFRSIPVLEDKYYTSYEKRWHDYFRSFKNGLPLLRHFHYGHSPGWDDVDIPFESETQMPFGMTDESYMVFCEGYGGGPLMKFMIYDSEGDDEYGEPLKPTEEDEKALNELLVKTGQRI